MSPRRLLVLGGTGKLGSHVVRAAAAGGGTHIEAPSRQDLDLAVVDEAALRARIGAGTFDAVLNCAAAADVDACERDPDRAHRINAAAPGMIARACAGGGTPFIHLSTDYVFGGPSAPEGPFDETAVTGPAQIYGQSKAAGERAVLAAGGRRTVARVSWLFGTDPPPFARFVLEHAARGGPVPVFAQASRPTWLPGLAAWLLQLAAMMSDGAFVPDVLHPAGGPAASREEWARALLEAHGLGHVRVVRSSPAESQAPRPRDSRLATDRTDAWMRATWAAGLPDWRDKVRG